MYDNWKKRNSWKIKDWENAIDIVPLSDIYREISLRRRKEKPMQKETPIITLQNRLRVVSHDIDLVLQLCRELGEDAPRGGDMAVLLKTIDKITGAKEKIIEELRRREPAEDPPEQQKRLNHPL